MGTFGAWQAGIADGLQRELVEVRAERDHLKRREAHFARVLGVADGGQYRNDWDARLTGIVEQRDELLLALKRVVELSQGYPLLQAELDIPLAVAAIEKAEST